MYNSDGRKKRNVEVHWQSLDISADNPFKMKLIKYFNQQSL